MEGLLCLAGFLVIPCAVLGCVVGTRKNAAAEGLVLGLIFGPLGVIVTFAIDKRPQCYQCAGRLDDQPKVCPHCRAELAWPYYGPPMHPEEAKRQQQQETIAAKQEQTEAVVRLAERRQQREESLATWFDAFAWVFERGKQAALWLCRQPGRADSAMRHAFGDENVIIYRFTQIMLYAVAPGLLLAWIVLCGVRP